MQRRKTQSKVTMRQIAAKAAVSVGTVSHVINNTAGVREPLRRRVLEAINRLGFRPSLLARGLRRSQTTIVGMIIPDILNPFFPQVVRGVEDVLFKESYRLMLCNADNDAKKEQISHSRPTTLQRIEQDIRPKISSPPLHHSAPTPEARPTTIEGWTLHEVSDGVAILEGPNGVWKVKRGDTVPGVGRVESIVRWGNNWIVATKAVPGLFESVGFPAGSE